MSRVLTLLLGGNGLWGGEGCSQHLLSFPVLLTVGCYHSCSCCGLCWIICCECHL